MYVVGLSGSESVPPKISRKSVRTCTYLNPSRRRRKAMRLDSSSSQLSVFHQANVDDDKNE
jgi:hypothetical protein